MEEKTDELSEADGEKIQNCLKVPTRLRPYPLYLVAAGSECLPCVGSATHQFLTTHTLLLCGPNTPSVARHPS